MEYSASIESEERMARRRAGQRRRRFIAGAGLAFFVIILTLPLFSIGRPGFYERFKPLRGRIQTWHTSTHAQMTCLACHLEPGTEKALEFLARAMPVYYGAVLGQTGDPGLFTTPTKAACQKCHTAYRQVSASGDLLIPHRAHVVVLKLNCADCHQRLVHSPNPSGFNSPKMGYCLSKCHDGRKATNRCTDCHTEKATPDNHKSGNWLQVHGQKTEQINCGRCHGWAPKLCQACHTSRPRTHVGNWKKEHKGRALIRGKGCLVCHGGKKFCLKCHDEGLFAKVIYNPGMRE